jgi:hypothetical protein
LGTIIKPDYSERDLPWLQKLVAGLVRDGLADCNEAGIKLP